MSILISERRPTAEKEEVKNKTVANRTDASAQITFTATSERTVVSRLRAGNPLKILTPRQHGKAASAFISTLGGGLLAGDHLTIHIDAEAGACGVVSTQSATKIYRSADGRDATQILHATVNTGANLLIFPDPVMCFAHARYVQRQTFRLPADNSAGLCLLDSVVSGRRARGESWAFDLYSSCNEIYVGDRLIFHDAMRLSPMEGPLDHPSRMGRYHCIATLVLVGNPMMKYADAILSHIGKQPIRRGAPLVAGASPMCNGVVVRIAGVETQDVTNMLHGLCLFASDLDCDDLWARKW